MKIVWTLFKNNIKNLTAKSPVFTIIFIFLPVIISIGISMLIPSTKILNGIVINSSDSELSKAFIQDISNNKCFEISINDSADIQNEIKLGNYDFGIIINKNFDEYMANANSADGLEVFCCNSAGYLKILENTLTLELNNISNIYNSNKQQDIEGLHDYIKNKTHINSINMDGTVNDYTATNMLFSFLIMFSFLRAMTGASLINKDKELGVYTRILITEASPIHYYIANVCSSVVLVAIQNALALFLIGLCSNIVWGGSWIEILIIILTLSFVAVTLGNFFFVCTENKEVSNILSTFVAIILLMAGIVPKAMLPKAAVIMSSIIPTRWAVNCLETLQAGGNLVGCILHLSMMLICATVLLAITVFGVKKRT